MKHLNDEEMAAVLAGENLDGAADGHLDTCLACRQQLADLRSLIDQRRGQMRDEEPDWESQRQAVMAGLGDPERVSRQRPRWQRPLLAAAAVVLLAIGVRELTPPAVPTAPVIENDIQIEEILADVDAMLSDDSLPGFESIDPGFDDPESMIENGAS